MTEEEIKKVVSLTIDELKERQMYCEESELTYQFMSVQLKQYYKTRTNKKIGEAIKELLTDPYFMIIPMFYRDDKTITAISVTIGCDRATVSRNKKRIVLELYNKCYSE